MLAPVDVSGEIRGAVGTSLSLGLGAVMEPCCVSSPFPSGIRDFLESVVLVVCQFGISVVDPCAVMK